MAYVVRDVSYVGSKSEKLDAEPLTSFAYPVSRKCDSKFRFTLGLYSLHDLPSIRHSTFLSYFGQIFGGDKHTHYVILDQTDQHGEVIRWVLYHATCESDGREGMDKINRTLLPLIKDGMAFLTEDLLASIITPQPTPPEELGNIVLEMMENNPFAHPEWPPVVQAVLKSSEKEQVQPSKKERTAQKKTSFTRVKESVILNSQFSAPAEAVDVHAAARENKHDSIRHILVKQASRRSLAAAIEDVSSLSPDSTDYDEDVFDFDAVDTHSQDTPLYTSLRKGYTKSCLFFLLGGANPNFVHPVSGNSCLHLATEQGSVQLIKLLLLFYANTTIRNKKGKTPLDLLPDIPEYEEVKSMFEEIEYLKKEYDSLPSDPVKRATEEGEFLLCFDGGGSRCISEIQGLIAVEKRMLELNPHCKPFISHFDYLAGTSGGGFHVLTLAYNQVTLKNDRALTVNGATYTEGSSPYEKTRNIEKLIKSTLGEERVMADVTTPRCIITSTLANTIPPKLHLITNYGEARDGQLGPHQRKIWEAARITSAAPTYLMSFQHFLDGGMMANNPTVDALVEMNQQSLKEKGHPLKISCVLSLGSGQSKPVNVQNIDVTGRKDEGYIMGLASKVDGYKNLISLVVSQITQTEGQDLARAKAMCDISGGAYFRLTAPVGKAISLDTNNPIDLIQPMFDSFMFTLRNPRMIDTIARTLLSNPRLY